VTREVADLLFRTQFRTIRLGFETSNEFEQHETGGMDNPAFRNAVSNLRKAGFAQHGNRRIYHGRTATSEFGHVKETVAFVKQIEQTLSVEYSPIPGHPFEEAKRVSDSILRTNPVYNNSILPCSGRVYTGGLEKNERELKEI